MLQVGRPGPLPELTSLSTGDYLESWLSQVRGRVRGRTYQGCVREDDLPMFPVGQFSLAAGVPEPGLIRAWRVYAENILGRYAHKLHRSATYPGLCYLVKQ